MNKQEQEQEQIVWDFLNELDPEVFNERSSLLTNFRVSLLSNTDVEITTSEVQ